MQYFPLAKPVTVSQLKISLNSVYAGTLSPDDTLITEIELGSNLTQLEDENQTSIANSSRPAWQKFFINIWDKIIKWIKELV